MRLLIVCAVLFGVVGLALAADNQRPTITITMPTTGATYTAMATPLLVRGTASDRKGHVALVTWSTDRGASGTATGTTAWQAAIPLGVGTTRLTVRAVDTSHNTATDLLTITLAGPPPPPPPPPVSHVLAWDYHMPVPAQVAVDQCLRTAQGCPMQQVAVLPGSQQTVELGNLSATARYCWVVRSLAAGEVSNEVCTP